MIKKRNLILLGIGLVCVFVIYQLFAVSLGFFPFHRRVSSPEPVSDSTGEPIRIDVVGYPSSHRPEEALPFADLVVVAEITEIGKARWSSADGLRPAEWQHNPESIAKWTIYTPFAFKTIEVLKGNVTGELASEFAALGGQVEDDRVDTSEIINLYTDINVGDKMVLFLSRATGDLANVAPYAYVDALRVDDGKATADCQGSRSAEDCRVSFELSDVLTKVKAARESAK